MTAEERREREARLREDVRASGRHIGAMFRSTRPIGFIGRHLAAAAQRDREQAFLDAQDEASEMAAAGNPRRADYIEHMARRLT